MESSCCFGREVLCSFSVSGGHRFVRRIRLAALQCIVDIALTTIVAAAADSMIAAVVMTIDEVENEAAMTAATMTVEAVVVVSIDVMIAAVMIAVMTIDMVAVTTEGMRTETEAMEDMDGIRGRQGKNY